MKTLIWSLFGLLALLWSGLCWAGAALLRWAAGLLSGTGNAPADWGRVLADWPLPQWLALWADVAALRSLLELIASMVESLQAVWPGVDSALAWLMPLLWVVWGGGLLMLIGLTGLALWLARAARPVPPAQPHPAG
jgi:hypothetical protein